MGVDLPQYDAAVVFWPSLHISARRRLRAENRDPDIAEMLQGVQLGGRILRPGGPEERYEEMLKRKIIVFADARFFNHVNYLQRYFEVRELPLNLT